MSRSGLFITLEGIEGAGKSTVARSVREWLGKRGWNVVLTREPGGTPLAERVRQIVLERGEEHLSGATETLLMFAARGIHLDNLIRPALERGDCVVCDRFTDASRAYQGAARGIDPAWIESLARQVQGDLQPDCTLLLDLPVPLGLERARSRHAGAADRFEAEAQAFFERVRAGYLELARLEPTRIHVIDASVALEAVERQVVAVLERLPLAASRVRAP
ncbi:MAG: dTMP kinase [Steroidobacteraceae bacterium]